jgi:hypothetical protein
MHDPIESIVSKIRQLPFDERLKVIQRIAADLMQAPATQEQRRLVYSKYRRAPDRMSTEEDFAPAEWRPSQGERCLWANCKQS